MSGKTERIYCPVCGSKTRLQIRLDTELKNFPLYCPKCKQENLIDVVERSKYDMPFKDFLDMAPEESVINPGSLTKFRRLRLKDMNLLDVLVAKTVQIALEKGLIKSKSIIVDATHTKSRYNQKTPRQAFLEQPKKLRRSVYETDETMKERFPDKNTEDSLEKELEYCQALISVIKEKEELHSYPKI